MSDLQWYSGLQSFD